ncbi:amidohydrolase family protein [Pasteuria penetrans]|uniref:amidohydrolase family protein n=1 Tax=Pasteuria penetrans TaxID=86005 RepID=UPI000F957BED|nr:amidohydrolase [Pasteuria penetrans]
MRQWLRAGSVWTKGKASGEEIPQVLKSAAVGICGKEIIYVGPDDPERAATYDRIVDLRDCFLMPGFINAHTHMGLSLLRGYAEDLPLARWLHEKIFPLEDQMDGAVIAVGTRLAIAEMIRTGTTCCLDMYFHMHEVAGVVEETGFRACLCSSFMGDCSEEDFLEKLRESEQFCRYWYGKGQGRITTAIAPHAPYTCRPDQLRQAAELSQRLDLPIHIHIAETRREVEEHKERYQLHPVTHLQEIGILQRPCILAHVVHVGEEEIEQLAEGRAHVVHNPRSNLKLGSGIAPVVPMLRSGLCPALGTDSSASNNSLDMLSEVQMACLLHKGVYEDPMALSAGQALRMGTEYGAYALGLSDRIGTLEVGKQADVVAWNLEGVCHAPGEDPVTQLVYSAGRSDVHSVYVAGRCLLENGVFQVMDEEKIVADAKQALQTLRARC